MIQIGVDFGGTKIEAAALNPEGAFLARIRAPNPGSYDAALRTVQELVQQAESMAGAKGTVGIGTPGSISPRTGLWRDERSAEGGFSVGASPASSFYHLVGAIAELSRYKRLCHRDEGM
jgi:predicted NBD/HSP70 family sugar kinase